MFVRVRILGRSWAERRWLHRNHSQLIDAFGAPYGNRTRVSAVKGRWGWLAPCPAAATIETLLNPASKMRPGATIAE